MDPTIPNLDETYCPHDGNRSSTCFSTGAWFGRRCTANNSMTTAHSPLPAGVLRTRDVRNARMCSTAAVPANEMIGHITRTDVCPTCVKVLMMRTCLSYRTTKAPMMGSEVGAIHYAAY